VILARRTPIGHSYPGEFQAGWPDGEVAITV